jgi:hypothetical protein
MEIADGVSFFRDIILQGATRTEGAFCPESRKGLFIAKTEFSGVRRNQLHQEVRTLDIPAIVFVTKKIC